MEINEVKHRIEELDLARPYLNSDYYWERRRNLQIELKSMEYLLNEENNKYISTSIIHIFK